MLHAGRTLACTWRQAHDERMHDRGVGLRTVCVGLGLGLAVLCAACTASVGHGSSAQVPAGGRQGATITVGSFNFSQSNLLAYIYADVLPAKGFSGPVLPGPGAPRPGGPGPLPRLGPL